MATDPHNLKALEDKLNQDTAARDAFLKDPAAALKKEGITLTADQLKAVEGQVAEMNLAGISKLAARPKIHIGITITIRF